VFLFVSESYPFSVKTFHKLLNLSVLESRSRYCFPQVDLLLKVIHTFAGDRAFLHSLIWLSSSKQQMMR
jgi:hypothetical protein